ncbi:MAG: 2-oxoacid:acceptor oxidoreductase subunit alpha [Acidobacteriota bacterium]
MSHRRISSGNKNRGSSRSNSKVRRRQPGAGTALAEPASQAAEEPSEAAGKRAGAAGRGVEEIESAVVRFAGDSGDGMQVAGSQFTTTTALLGNDLATLPDFPAEIRAPAGTLAGVSGFQIHFSSLDIRTPGDTVQALVAMNPAALRVNQADLEPGGILITNRDAFNDQNLQKAGYEANPLEDGSLKAFRVVDVPLTSLTLKAVEETGLSRKLSERCKNFYALGLLFWLYDRPPNHTLEWIRNKFAARPEVVEANTRALQAGLHYAETIELFSVHYRVRPAKLSPGLYRQITGNEAAALGFIAASKLAQRPLFYGSYPITPASDILQEIAKYRQFGAKTFQAEDEIAAIGAAIGAAYGGALGLCGTSGPGLDLKSEALGLAVMAELPLVIADVQRVGPSTGMPTKTEQGDLLEALFGRHGECPVAVVAPRSPSDCFNMAIEAFRIAIRYMTPVIFLSDGYLANGAEPWCIPKVEDLPKFDEVSIPDAVNYQPYARNPSTLARPWVTPGSFGYEHRIGGLEKEDITGNVSYDPINHEKMTHLRAEKVARIAENVPELEVDGDGPLLVLGWGSTYGAIFSAIERVRRSGGRVARAHLRYLNPFPRNIDDVLSRFKQVLIPELNMGQLALLLSSRTHTEVISLSKVQGKPFQVSEIEQRIEELLGSAG